MSVSPAVITVDYREFEGSPQEGLGDDGRFHATRVLKCAWADRLTLARELFGSVQLVAPTGIVLDVVLPAEYPHLAGAFVKSVPTITGFPATNPDHDESGEPSKDADYESALVTAQYEVPLFETNPPGGAPRIEETLEPEAEFLTVAVKDLRWQDTSGTTPLEIDEAPGIQLRKMTWVYRIMGIPTLPAATLDLLGFVNGSNIVSQKFGWSFRAETLLYQAPSLTRYFYSGGQSSAWGVTYRFSFDPQEWNMFHRPGYPMKQPIFYGLFGPRYRPYPLGDFTQIVFQ